MKNTFLILKSLRFYLCGTVTIPYFMRFNLSLLYMLRFVWSKRNAIWHKKWTDHFFTNLNGKQTIDFQQLASIANISSRTSKFKVDDCTLTMAEDNLPMGIVLLGYHSYGARELSPTIVLAAYIALRLKRCVILTLPWEYVHIRVLYL